MKPLSFSQEDNLIYLIMGDLLSIATFYPVY